MFSIDTNITNEMRNICELDLIQKYFWVVELKNGTKITEFNSDGTENLASWVKYPQGVLNAWFVPFNGSDAHKITLDDEEKLVLVKRIRAGLKSDGLRVKERIFIFGAEGGPYRFINEEGLYFDTNDFNDKRKFTLNEG